MRKQTTKFLFLFLLSSQAMAITMPAPPPELPDTLTSFRTRELALEDANIENSLSGESFEEIPLDENPFVPGDDTSGIVRYAHVYTPSMAVGIPENGLSIMRFYDLNGVPWDISSVKTENQGFSAEVTASPSELLIKQNSGASATTLAVTLNNYPSPLVFSLTSVRLEREGVKVNTLINAVRVKNLISSTGYVYPKIREVPKPNPLAESIKYDKQDAVQIEMNLIDAVRGLRLDEE